MGGLERGLLRPRDGCVTNVPEVQAIVAGEQMDPLGVAIGLHPVPLHDHPRLEFVGPRPVELCRGGVGGWGAR